MTSAAIQGSFAEYQMIKTRGQLVVKIEFPLEQQAEVFAVLGFPEPGKEIPVAIARLQNPADPLPVRPAALLQNPPEPASRGVSPKSQRAKELFAQLSPEHQIVAQAGMLAKNETFQAWLAGPKRFPYTELEAADYIHHYCGIKSRRELVDNGPARAEFAHLIVIFKTETGQMAEVR